MLKNWGFWTVVQEKMLESPLDCKEFKPVNPKGNQAWIFTGKTELKLKLQYFGHWHEEITHWKRLWCWKRLKAKWEGSDRGWDGLDSMTNWMDMNLSKLQEIVGNKGSWCAAVHGSQKVRCSNWTKAKWGNWVNSCIQSYLYQFKPLKYKVL